MAARVAYFSFDAVPAPKGAATHIEAFARALAGAFGGCELVTVGGPSDPVERWPGVLHTGLPAAGASLIDRVLCFRRHLQLWLAGRRFDIVHFRSIFEGMPLLGLDARRVFEVNGLPSIELKYRYPAAGDDRDLMAKLVAQERACLGAADLVITPSAVTAQYLEHRRGRKALIIANGVDLDVFRFAPPRGGNTRLLYFGTLAAWQGVDLAIRAAAQLPGATLTIIGAGNRRGLARLADKLGARVTILPPVSQAELVERLHQSDAVLAPLKINDRNVVQGCCPLKILESMATGTPVIASDLPVVRELGESGRHFILVKPGSVDQLTEAVRQLTPERAQAIAREARARIEEKYTWERASRALIAAYSTL